MCRQTQSTDNENLDVAFRTRWLGGAKVENAAIPKNKNFSVPPGRQTGSHNTCGMSRLHYEDLDILCILYVLYLVLVVIQVWRSCSPDSNGRKNLAHEGYTHVIFHAAGVSPTSLLAPLSMQHCLQFTRARPVGTMVLPSSCKATIHAKAMSFKDMHEIARRSSGRRAPKDFC